MIVKCNEEERDRIIKQAMESENYPRIIREDPEYIDPIIRGLELNIKYSQLQRIRDIIKSLETKKALEYALSNEAYLMHKLIHGDENQVKIGQKMMVALNNLKKPTIKKMLSHIISTL